MSSPSRNPRDGVAALLGEYDQALHSGDSPRLRSALESLAAASKTPPPGLDPKLTHYLQSQSYRKALDLLARSA
jgi:hypothetical protein